MTFSIIALLIGLGALLYHKFASPLPPAALAGALVVAGGIWFTGFILDRTGPSTVQSHYMAIDEAIGFAIGQQIANDGVPPGQVLIVNPPKSGETWEKRFEARQAGLVAGGGPTYTFLDQSTADVRDQIEYEPEEQLPVEVQKDAGVATVSFVGMPRNASGREHPIYVVLGPRNDVSRWHAAIRSARIAAVVREKSRREWTEPAGKTPGALFDSRYDLYHSDNLPPMSTLVAPAPTGG